MKRFVLTLLLLLVPTLGLAGERIIYDNDGNRYVVDTSTAGTPGAGSGLGAIMYAMGDSLPATDQNKFDFQLGLDAIGISGTDSSQTITTGAALFYRPESWVRVGGQLLWDTVDTDKLDLSIQSGLVLFPDPWDRMRVWLNLDVLPHFVVRTEGGTLRENAISWAPAAGLSLEIPKQSWSVEIDGKLSYALALEGVTEDTMNDALEEVTFGVGIKVNKRLGRN